MDVPNGYGVSPYGIGAYGDPYRTCGQAEAVETAQPLRRVKVRMLGQAVEQGFARSLGRTKVRAVAAAVELSTAAAVTARHITRRVIGQAVELSTATGFAPPGGYGVDPYGDSPYGSPVGGARRKVRMLGQAVEQDTAEPTHRVPPPPPSRLIATHVAVTLATAHRGTRLEAHHA